MGGCADWSWPDRVRLSLEAGHDWLLVCQSAEGTRACAEAADALPAETAAPALARNRTLRRHLPPPQPGPLDSAAWADWVDRIHIASGGI
jgi:beta-N-acetylhexosaminidase